METKGTWRSTSTFWGHTHQWRWLSVAKVGTGCEKTLQMSPLWASIRTSTEALVSYDAESSARGTCACNQVRQPGNGPMLRLKSGFFARELRLLCNCLHLYKVHMGFGQSFPYLQTSLCLHFPLKSDIKICKRTLLCFPFNP
ncbi:hypothetical protein PanWU01x14_163510 [Parasponia andersonii]|uniref:Uncharacterized protein n=1 Tax=Parasponia andersonii TaxID=3476 RepID=A0A2P5CCP7_PARAD|nr:hypothetical protein PanWU01x14_163510 [Parasponia andersonii]